MDFKSLKSCSKLGKSKNKKSMLKKSIERRVIENKVSTYLFSARVWTFTNTVALKKIADDKSGKNKA